MESTRILAGHDMDIGELATVLRDLADSIDEGETPVEAVRTDEEIGIDEVTMTLGVEFILTEENEHLREPIQLHKEQVRDAANSQDS